LAVDGEQARVVGVTDGDTFDVEVDGRPDTVRLIGINTPERDECFYDQATDALADLVEGEQVALVADVSDRDQYGRLLRYAYVGERFVNEALVVQGVARSRSYPPDTAQQAVLDEAEEGARDEGEGLWAGGACGGAGSSTGDGELTAGPSGDGAAAEVQIAEAVADPPGPDEDDPNAETVTIANTGSGPAALGGWVLRDTSSTHRYTFPAGFVLPPGGQVVVHTGCGDDSTTALHWCNAGSLVWNNTGDTAYLEDPAGNTVSVLEV